MGSPQGWRAKIGVMYPYITGILPCWPDEYRRIAPEGIEFVEAKLIFPTKVEPGVKDDKEAFPILAQYVEQAAREVALQKVDVIIQLGGALSIYKGWGGDREILSTIEKATGIPTTTHGIAEIEALKKLDIHKVVAVTPYNDNVNAGLENYFRGAGLDVVATKRIGVVREVYEASPYGIYRRIKETFLSAPPADGVIMMCGAIRTFPIIQALEYDLGKPVVTANQAALWKLLNMVSVREPIKGFGRLLETF